MQLRNSELVIIFAGRHFFAGHKNVLIQMKVQIFILLFLLTSILGNSQVAVRGIIKDAESNEPLVGANILDSFSLNGTSSNHVGYFLLFLNKKKKTQLRFSFVGYKPLYLEFSGVNDTILSIGLFPQDLEEVVISANSNTQNTNSYRQTNITIEELRKLPQLFGEKDVLKSLQALPGVSNGVEGTSGLIVRGGSMDQNLILIDHATVYNPNHLLGFVSVVNSDAIKDLKIYTGGFAPQYGGRLSSVIDLTMKEGNKSINRQQFSMGLISSKLLLEGPLKKGKSSYLFSARSSYLGLLLLPQKINFNRGNSESYFNYWLYDLNGKLSFDLRKNSKLQISFYRSFDNWKAVEGAKVESTEGILSWSNNMLAARFSKPVGKKSFFNAVFGYSDFKLNTALRSPYIRSNLNSGVSDLFLKSIATTSINTYFELKYGFQSVYHLFVPVSISTNLNDKYLTSKLNAFETSIFVESSLTIEKNFVVNGGLRYSGYGTKGKVYILPEPRLILSYFFNKYYSLSASYSKMWQFIHLLNNGNTGLPNDVWLPTTESIPPQSANHFTLKFEQVSKIVDISIEAFYKYSSGLIDYNTGGNILFSYNKNWEDLLVTNGIGKSYGTEFLVKKSKGAWSGWIAYTLAKHQRQFEPFNNGNWFPYNFDRRHEVELYFNYSFGKNIKKNISFSWIYQSGIAITTPVGYYLNSENQFVPIYTSRNNNRAPDYHRLDVSYSILKNKKNGNQVGWTFGVYNFYNRKNPFYLAFKKYSIYQNPTDFLSPVIGASKFAEKGSFLPILPYISYEIKFH